MIKSIQQQTAKAVAAMEEGVKEVGRGTDDAARSGLALQDILSKIEGLTLQVNQIATAAEQQTATTGQISQNLIEVHEAANDASRGAQETAAAASKLAGAADELKSLGRHFRL
jgi:methyl-accepting chemotaxis protein